MSRNSKYTLKRPWDELHLSRERDPQAAPRQSAHVITRFCTLQKISWKFIPRCTSHFGGLWEPAVKSLKSHLRYVLGEANLSSVEFSTVLVQVEACLNYRPLTPIPETTDAVESLTPSLFLIGRPITSLPDESDHQVVEPPR